MPLAGRQVVELGCGMAVPSLVAARAGAEVLASDEDPEALELVERNARENNLRLHTARVEWASAGGLVARGPFDLVLAADVLYERASVATLLALLPRLAGEVLLADPGRDVAGAFFDQASREWRVERRNRDGIGVYRLVAKRSGRRSSP